MKLFFLHRLRRYRLVGLLIVSVGFSNVGTAKQVLRFESTAADMTPVVRAALEAVTDRDVKLVFAAGSYRFLPDYAVDRYCTITNHGNGLKKVIFPLAGFASIEIEGNGAEFIFHGLTSPFQFEQCEEVKVSNLSIDWDIPFIFQGDVLAVNQDEGWYDLQPATEGFSWEIKQDQLKFPNVDGFSFSHPGSALTFDKRHKRVSHGALDFESSPRWVEKRQGGVLRFHEPLKRWPEVGTVLTFKGDRAQDRYAPAFKVTASRNVTFTNVVVHHALGMGFLFERTADITISGGGVYLPEGSPRMISSTADATHFANCKGDILIENARIENMLDDGTNVHGTYVEVDGVVDAKTVRVGLKHFEQSGFEFAAAGDEVWFIHQPNPSRGAVNEVVAVKRLNEQFTELTFRDALPTQIAVGDVLENKTWNPRFTMRGCAISNHRARNIVLKTPLPTVIEDNDFSSMMSSIFFRGETFFWFESGAVVDVLIRGNRFNYCAYSGMEHSVINITPRLGRGFDQKVPFDRNIRIENNIITTFDSRIVWADRVDGLVIKNNTIIRTTDAKPLYPDAAVFDFRNCRNVEVSGNRYEGVAKTMVAADAATKPTLKVENNVGF